MDGADSSGIESSQHAEPMFDVGHITVLESVVAGRANSVSHLASGPLGEGNRDELMELCRSFPCGDRVESGEESLCQHEGFPATRTGRQSDGDAACENGC